MRLIKLMAIIGSIALANTAIAYDTFYSQTQQSVAVRARYVRPVVVRHVIPRHVIPRQRIITDIIVPQQYIIPTIVETVEITTVETLIIPRKRVIASPIIILR